MASEAIPASKSSASGAAAASIPSAAGATAASIPSAAGGTAASIPSAEGATSQSTPGPTSAAKAVQSEAKATSFASPSEASAAAATNATSTDTKQNTKRKRSRDSAPSTIYTLAVLDVENKPRPYEIVKNSYTTKRAALISTIVDMAGHLLDSESETFRNMLDLTDNEKETEPTYDAEADSVFAALSKFASHERYRPTHLRQWLRKDFVTNKQMTKAMDRLNDLCEPYYYSIEERQLMDE